MLRMAHRIAMATPESPHLYRAMEPEERRGTIKLATGDMMLVKDAHVISVDNVAQFYALHDQQEWDYTEDFPNCAPPFPLMLFEWNLPQLWNMPEGMLDMRDKQGFAFSQTGVVVMGFNVTDETRNDAEGWATFLAASAGYGPIEAAEMVEVCRDMLPTTRWVVRCSPWGTLKGIAICSGIVLYLFIDEKGVCQRSIGAGPALGFHQRNEVAQMMWTAINIVQLSLSFMHCKNVKRIDSTAELGPEAKWLRRQKLPEIKYHTLEIEGMKEVLAREGNSETDGLKKALHVCRGHFAHYTEEKPLFGRLTGDFWRPSHVRGTEKAGVVNKGYDVKPPRGDGAT